MKPRLNHGFIILVLFVFFAASSVFAQDVAGDNDDEDSTGSVIDLGRRSKVVVEKLKNKVMVDKIDPKAVLNLDSGLGVFDAFFASLSMILVSEIGDETFIIAALMAMRHPKSIVLSGALSALFVMTILSTGLGRIVPNLISRKHTNSAATVLYAFFGLRLLYIAWRSDSKASQKKEMEEVEEKLESGQGKTAARRFFSRFCTPIFLESFILTFLAEWGDRSQIATIALATHKNALGVAVGATIGHTICTSVAVIGGSMLASKISQKTVATVGGLLFLGFSLSSYFYPPLVMPIADDKPPFDGGRSSSRKLLGLFKSPFRTSTTAHTTPVSSSHQAQGSNGHSKSVSVSSVIRSILPTRRRLRLDPRSKLYFPYEPGKQVQSAIKIKNTSKSHVAFKFQTTAPKSCFMRPPGAILTPGETIIATVFKFVEPPENNEKPIDRKRKVKFKIMSLKVKGMMDYVPELFDEQKDLVTVEQILQVVFLDVARPSPALEKLKRQIAEAEAALETRKKPPEDTGPKIVGDGLVIDEWKERRERYLARQQGEGDDSV